MLRTILSIQPRVSASGSEKTPDEIVLELVSSLQKDLPPLLSRVLDPKTPDIKPNQEMWITNEKGLIPSLSTVLLQEMTRFNTLLQAMDVSLKSLDKAIKGLVVMSQDLDSMYFSLLNN
jgi:dynein heavy chain, axonemal